MARAKNMSRSEARRRTRAALREESAELEASEELDAAPDSTTTVAERPRLFKMPNVREDIRALPGIFRSRRLLLLPALILVVGLVFELVRRGLSPELSNIADIYNQFFFIPPALFTFFIAGFLAPRASYLVGFLYGVFAASLWTVAVLAFRGALAAPAGTPPTLTADPVSDVAQLFILGAVYGTLAAAFAAWYRDFLRQMQNRGQQRRADQEAKERAKRREERQAARSVFKRS